MSFEVALLVLRVIAVVILYAFLGIAFYLLWRDLARGSAPPADTADRLRLLAQETPAENGQEIAYPLRPVTTLGRSPHNTIVLQDEFASTTHAQLIRQKGVWWLEDLGSRNGTYLNDMPISRPTPLAPGDVIKIGQVRLQLESAPSTITVEERSSSS